MDELAELGGWPAVLGPLLAGRDLTTDQARAAMAEILRGTATPAQLAGFVVALRMKGESVDELTGLLAAMLAAAELVPLDDDVRARAVDVVGTGGDRSHTINVSTLASLVVAGAGVPVCKHGNRAASSSCGSADLLEALGVNLELSPAGVAECLAVAGMAFCFAPRFHPALRHAGPSRRELGIPTAFNILGPMANPGRVRRMVVGVADPSMAERMLDRGGGQTEPARIDRGAPDLTVLEEPHRRRRGRGQLVEAVVTVDHEHPDGPMVAEDVEHPLGHRRIGDADHHPADPSGVGHRAEDVEGRRDAELAP